MTPFIPPQTNATEIQTHILPSQPGSVVSLAQARESAIRAIAALGQKHDFVILDAQTTERPFGWVFFYTTRKYTETNDPRFLVPGTAPIVVHRAGGRVAQLPSSSPPQLAIEQYEAQFEKSLRNKGP